MLINGSESEVNNSLLSCRERIQGVHGQWDLGVEEQLLQLWTHFGREGWCAAICSPFFLPSFIQCSSWLTVTCKLEKGNAAFWWHAAYGPAIAQLRCFIHCSGWMNKYISIRASQCPFQRGLRANSRPDVLNVMRFWTDYLTSCLLLQSISGPRSIFLE